MKAAKLLLPMALGCSVATAQNSGTARLPSTLTAFFRANPDYRLLEFNDLGRWKSSYKKESDWHPFSVGDTNGDGTPDVVAVVVTKSAERRFNVVCLHGAKGNGPQPAPMWVIKDEPELILEVAARTREFWAIICNECDANSPMRWVGGGYEWGVYAPKEFACLLDKKLYKEPNSKLPASVLSGLRAAEILEVGGRAEGRDRWYKVRNLKSEEPFIGWVMTRKIEQPEIC